jgi:hypothetical protein
VINQITQREFQAGSGLQDRLKLPYLWVRYLNT